MDNQQEKTAFTYDIIWKLIVHVWRKNLTWSELDLFEYNMKCKKPSFDI